jgi:lipopolysaccharide export system permease protein
MKISPTFSRYLARTYIYNLLVVLLALLAVLYLFETVEVLRRASKRADVPLSLVFQIALLKLPKEGQTLLPFAILFSAMFTFWQLTRRHELTVARAAGISFWQFLTPIVAVAVLAGALHVTIINPLSSVFISNYERMARTYLSGKRGADIALFREGLWLRQDTDEGYAILNAKKIKQPGWVLQEPMVLFFSSGDRFLKRIDAAEAKLEPGHWSFSKARAHDSEASSTVLGYKLPTTLTPLDIQESFSAPDTMSFWKLPSHIRILEETGFDPSRLKVYYQSLLAQPFLFAAMVLLAAAASLRPPRTQGTFALIAAGVGVGFLVFFASSFLEAMGATQQIPVILAAWSPAIISIMFGLGVLMAIEDG